MKKIFRLSALFCAMTLLVTSCTKDVVEEQPAPNPEVDGTEIQFGARAGFETTDDTRTVYSGVQYTDKDDKKRERIDWVEGDRIEIYSPEAKGVNPAHYYVTKTTISTDGASDGGYLTKLYDGGLQWNGEVATHHFYAMYPSSEVVNGISIGKSGENVIVKAAIENEQHAQGATTYDAEGNVTTDETEIAHYELAPDMDYAYMVATGEATADKGSVSLDFQPIVTAVRVQLVLPTSGVDSNGNTVSAQPTRLFSVRLSGEGIVGEYTANLSQYDEEGYPTITNGTAAADQSITMLVIGKDGLPITLQPGQSLAFTVFVRPGDDIDASTLTVSFSTDGLNYKSKGIGTSATIEKLKKTSVLGLKLPYQATKLSYANWMEQVRDDATILELSLPGTGGSFSYAYKGSNVANYQQQTLPVFDDPATENVVEPNQWDLGIRAFEMACDRPDDSVVDNARSLGGQDIMVNGSPMDYTIGEAIETLLDKVTVKNPNETAMAIITYQPQGGTGLNRHAYIFAQALANYYDELMAKTDENGNLKYKDKVILYTPETVMYDPNDASKSARGKLMIVARINQRGEQEHYDGEGINTDGSNNKFWDEDTNENGNWYRAKKYYTDNNIPILLINGCGSAKDRWQARGYQISADGVSWNPAPDMATAAPGFSDAGLGNSVEAYMLGTSYTDGVESGSFFGQTTYSDGNKWREFPAWNVKSTEGGQYGFSTSNGSQMVWYQDWARVVNLDYIAQQGGDVKNGFFERGDYPSHSGGLLGANALTKLLSNNNAIRWQESYNEKVADAKHTFDLAISDSPAYSNYVFINSLCGYLVDPGIHRSWKMFAPSMGAGTLGESTSSRYDWWGGLEGNIYELAWRINGEFGAYVLDVISSQGDRGSTGVVMMDRLSDNVSDGASNYLPSIIITNNLYSGALQQSTSGGTTGGGNTGDDSTDEGDNQKPGEGDIEDGI